MSEQLKRWSVEVEVRTFRIVEVTAPTRAEAEDAAETAVQAAVAPTVLGECFVTARGAEVTGIMS